MVENFVRQQQEEDDQRILPHVLGINCVALEVKYHKRCYEHYTSFLRHAKPKEEIKYKFNKSFESYIRYNW